MDGGFGGVPAAFEHLVADVAKGVDRTTAKLSFAREIHYSDRFAVALEIVDKVLAEEGPTVPALELRADLLEHLERFDEAEAVARAVLEREPDSREAWHTLASVFEHLERWHELLAAADRLLELERDS